jgi:hypothetical protein
MYTIDRRLPQRSFLKYIYHDNGNKPPYIARVPFFENITVGESRKANYSQYSILADNEFDFEYVGTESRKFSLTFEINLLHLLQEAYDFISLTNPASSKFVDKEKFKSFYKTNVNDNKIPFSKNLYLEYFSDPEVKTSADSVLDELLNKKQFAEFSVPATLLVEDSTVPIAVSPTIQSYIEILRTLYHAESLNERLSNLTSLTTALDLEGAVNVLESDRNLQIQQSLEDLTATLKVLDQVVYFTNIIRSSVLSKGKGTSVPPPLVYLNHGVLYQNVPCICTDYNLSIDKNVTYDLPTLLPFTLKFSVNLVEALGYARKTEFMYNEIGGLEQTLVSEDLTRRYEEFVGEFDYGWTSVINEPFSLDHLASQK